jgi:hypothetical protein
MDVGRDGGEAMIPCYWIHYRGGPVRCRWDEQMVDRLISGRLKRPGWFPDVVHYETMEAFRRNTVTESCIVMFPAGDHDERDVARLNADLGRLRNPVVFITSDEGSKFPVHLIKHPTATFFVMTPRTDREYPAESTFIGEGDADAGVLVEPDPSVEKDIDIFFWGQGGHRRRQEMFEAFGDWMGLEDREPQWAQIEVMRSPGFLQGIPRDEYLGRMARAKVALCPAGTATQDSFRVYEALTHGCVPVLDGVRNDGESPHYWGRLGGDLNVRVPIVEDWQDDLGSALQYALNDWPKSAVRAHEWWHWHRRTLALCLSASLFSGWDVHPAADQITVIIPTSPIPSHPSTAMIESTINSIRRYIDSEILVMVDGVRPEQADREADYWEYVRRLMLVAERADNVTPVVSWNHIHQSGLMRKALDHVTTPFVFFVEHDCPLDGQPIDFEQIIDTMRSDHLNVMRFHHESQVIEQHAHLYLETEPLDDWPSKAPYVRTMQWSQRPHLAHTSFYRELLDEYFAPGAKTMLEEVLHGVAEFAARKQGNRAWDEWRLAVYAPREGGMRRSLHLDGRSDDPQYPMTFAYPGERPRGAPRPGTR